MINNTLYCFGETGDCHRPNRGIFAKFCKAANCAVLESRVNKYRLVFVQLTEICASSVSARSEGSRVRKERHPGGDCAQRPQRSA